MATVESVRSVVQIVEGYSVAASNLQQLNQNLIQSFDAMAQASYNAFRIQTIQTAQESFEQIESEVSDIGRVIRETDERQNELTQSIESSEQAAEDFSGTYDKIKGNFEKIKGVFENIGEVAEKVLARSDEAVRSNARLNMLTGSPEKTQAVQEKIFASAQRSGVDYGATTNMITQLGLQSGDAFQNTDEMIGFTEALNKSFVIAGADGQVVGAVVDNLTQAMGNGVFQAHDLDAVFGDAPNIIQNIANYMNQPIEKVYDLAETGELSAVTVKNAMLSSLDDINQQFAAMPKTSEQVWTTVKNVALKEFTPILLKVNELVNSSQFQSVINGICNGIHVLATVAEPVFQMMAGLALAILDNMSWIAPILIGAAVAMGAYLMATKGVIWAQTIATAVATGFRAAQTFLSIGFGVLSGSTAAASAAVMTYNSAIWASPITWFLLILIAIIAVLYAVVAAINKVTGSTISATGIVIGAFAVLGAAIWNTVTGVINGIIRFLWTAFVEPWIGIIEFVLNVFNGGFNSFGDAVQNLLGNIISWFLSLGQVVTKIIDAIFGTDWTGGLEALKGNVLSWGKNEEAITLSREAPSLADLGIDRMNYIDAWDAGYGAGQGIEEKIKSMVQFGVGDTSPFDYDDLMDQIQGGVGTIADNTGAISGSLTYAEEDLKYMRDIAEREAINRYTTAEIRIEQHNENHINSNMDLDGVVGYLNDGVGEAVDIATEGGHE